LEDTGEGASRKLSQKAELEDDIRSSCGQQALGVLASLGFPRRDDAGAAFDPTRHEAIATTYDPRVPPGTVVQVVRPGYGEPDRQLRPAQVVVAKAD